MIVVEAAGIGKSRLLREAVSAAQHDRPGMRILPLQQAREEPAHAWSLFFTACAGSGPVLVVLEDLHWASSALLDVVEVAMRRASGPILLAVTSTDLGSIRPGFDADLDGATSMSLPRAR